MSRRQASTAERSSTTSSPSSPARPRWNCGGLSRAGGAARVQRHCFDNGLIIELCGREDQVVMVMPPLTIDPARHDRSLEVLQRALLASAQ